MENIIVQLEFALFKLHPSAELIYKSIASLNDLNIGDNEVKTIIVKQRDEELTEAIISVLEAASRPLRLREIVELIKPIGITGKSYQIKYALKKMTDRGIVKRNTLGSANVTNYELINSKNDGRTNI